MPRLGRWSLIHARPVISGFHAAVEERLGSLRLPFRQTNEVVQIGLQHTQGPRHESGVPDAYAIEYSRLGRFGKADIQRHLTVYVLRASLAAELANTEPTSEATDRLWQDVAQQGQQFGNAALAWATDTHSYRTLLTGQSSRNISPLAAADTGLAEAAFETIAYWEA